MDILLPNLDSRQISQKFIRGMVDRIVTGTARYGGWAANRATIDFVECAKDRIKQYQLFGNTEHLIDAANFLMAEFLIPPPGSHYTPEVDHNKSPGLIARDGTRVRHMDEVED